MNLEQLQTAVKKAKEKAQATKPLSKKAQGAWMEVARLYEEITKLTKKDSDLGKEARCGLIEAAIKSTRVDMAGDLLEQMVARDDIELESIKKCQLMFI